MDPLLISVATPSSTAARLTAGTINIRGARARPVTPSGRGAISSGPGHRARRQRAGATCHPIVRGRLGSHPLAGIGPSAGDNPADGTSVTCPDTDGSTSGDGRNDNWSQNIGTGWPAGGRTLHRAVTCAGVQISAPEEMNLSDASISLDSVVSYCHLFHLSRVGGVGGVVNGVIARLDDRWRPAVPCRPAVHQYTLPGYNVIYGAELEH